MPTRTLTKKLAHVKPGTLFVGVDLALDRNVAVVLTEQAEQLDRFGFPNDRDGYTYFYQRVQKLEDSRQAPGVLVGMEPTNFFWKLLAADLEQHHPEYSYRLVNPYTVKKHREGDQLDRSKDDNRDAFMVADLLRTGKFTETHLLHGEYAELRQYATLYTRLQRDLRRQKTLIWNSVGQLFPELGREFKDLTSQTALAMLRNHAAAAEIRMQPAEAFIAGVRADFCGQRLLVKRLGRIHRLAGNSVGLQDGTEALQLTLRLHIEKLEALLQHLETVSTALIDTFLALPEAAYMLSVPDLGQNMAAIILSEIGDPSHYTCGRQLIKLAGTQPVFNSSGRKTRSQTPMSHKGRPRLRTALFFAVLRLVGPGKIFAQDYQELLTREKNPLTKMQALGVLMNKLLRILWSLISRQSFYDPDYQQAV